MRTKEEEDEIHNGIVQQTKRHAIKSGVPPDVLKDCNDYYELYLRIKRWKDNRKLEENDKKRIKLGLEPRRAKIMHHLSDPIGGKRPKKKD